MRGGLDADVYRVERGCALVVVQLGMVLVDALGAKELRHLVAALLYRVGNGHYLYIVKLNQVLGVEAAHYAAAANESQTYLIHNESLPLRFVSCSLPSYGNQPYYTMFLYNVNA